MDSKSFKRQLRSTSLSNIKAVLDKDKQSYSTNTHLYSTQTISGNISGSSQKKPDKMVFGMSNVSSDAIYEKKITTFIEFMYKVNFSNSIYVDLSLSGNANRYTKKTYKVFVGPGNNSELIRSVVKRRFWLELTTTKSESNFIWTQDTQKEIHLKHWGVTLNNEQSLAQKTTYIKKTLMKYYQSRSFFIANEHFPLVCNKF